jgi:Protein of unknown function (DUF3015)
MKKYLLVTIGTMLFSSSVFAAGYGDAGCGLGSLIFGKQSGPIQILAATTNGSTWNQAFGISSGTSNCDAKGTDTSKLEQERFVASNLGSLAKDMAVGQGEQLTVLAGLVGCPAAQQTHFNTVAQQNYKTIFANDATAPADVLTAVKDVVMRDAELSATCIN